MGCDGNYVLQYLVIRLNDLGITLLADVIVLLNINLVLFSYRELSFLERRVGDGRKTLGWGVMGTMFFSIW